MTSRITIRHLASLSDADQAQLADVLVSCVDGGASVGFMAPFDQEDAIAFWHTLAPEITAGQRMLLVAEDDRGICGTVQLVLNLPANQPHRADLTKMLVHRRARRRGVGAALLQAAEATARECGRTLLVLDAVTSGDASRLYERHGWRRVGSVPEFALFPDGRTCSTTYYYRDLTDPTPMGAGAARRGSRYARIERERRFLVTTLPDSVDPENYVRLRDRFIPGVFLRLRRIERPDGTELLTKLGQKTLDPHAPSDPRRRQMTTCYFDPGSAGVLSSLDGPSSAKRRHTIRVSGRQWVIDVWEEPVSAAGLILAEVECDSDAELEAVEIPAWVKREVTGESQYSGWTLAGGGRLSTTD